MQQDGLDHVGYATSILITRSGGTSETTGKDRYGVPYLLSALHLHRTALTFVNPRDCPDNINMTTSPNSSGSPKDTEMQSAAKEVESTAHAKTDMTRDIYAVSAATNDQIDMLRLGKQQVFKRNFSFWPTLGFTSIYIATWEYLLVSVYAGLVNG